jgi:hypothetical protein
LVRSDRVGTTLWNPCQPQRFPSRYPRRMARFFISAK